MDDAQILKAVQDAIAAERAAVAQAQKHPVLVSLVVGLLAGLTIGCALAPHVPLLCR